MTRKDFEAIARSLKAATEYAVYKRSREAQSQHVLTCLEIALDLKKSNDRFEVRRFLLACGLSQETIDAL